MAIEARHGDDLCVPTTIYGICILIYDTPRSAAAAAAKKKKKKRDRNEKQKTKKLYRDR